mmetsp:Transcript_23673/g.54675  ORF Transcript_23673/g.54675 Transcript_23673/m.54675 type:complete len:215 (+) Transcript_23673:485-1129(+)
MNGELGVGRTTMWSYVSISTNDAVPGIENLQILWVRGRLVRLVMHAQLLHQFTQLWGSWVAIIHITLWCVRGVERSKWIWRPDEVFPPTAVLRIVECETILVRVFATFRFLATPSKEFFPHAVIVLLKKLHGLDKAGVVSPIVNLRLRFEVCPHRAPGHMIQEGSWPLVLGCKYAQPRTNILQGRRFGRSPLPLQRLHETFICFMADMRGRSQA